MSQQQLPISIEFFPPKTPEGVEKLRVVRQQLYALKPEFCSVTFGAGGSTQEGTFGTVREILAEGVDAASHISCIGATQARCASNWPRSSAWASSAWSPCAAICPAAMAPAASSSTPATWWLSSAPKPATTSTSRWPPTRKCIRRRSRPSRPAGLCRPRSGRCRFGHHPVLLQRRRLFPLRRRGGRAGRERADRARHHADHQLDAADALLRCLRRRDSALDPPAPAKLLATTRASIKAFGLDVVTRLCEQLRAGGAPGLHFYSMNQSAATLEICQRLLA